MNNTNSEAWDGLSLDFLEGIDNSRAFPVEVQLAEAGNTAVSPIYPMDVNELELIESKPVAAEIKQYKPAQPIPQIEEEAEEKVEKSEEFIKEVDVRLDDLINKVFSSSDRPIVIVSDDKIEYANRTALNLFEVEEKEIIGQNFFSFVDEDYWNTLAENIGVMLTDGKFVEANLKSKSGKLYHVNLEAIYLPDPRKFSFIVVGQGMRSYRRSEEKPANVSLYDAVTGLPNFYLFEDRVQMAINYENYKDSRLKKNMVAAVAISIDNIFVLRQQGVADFILKKLASKLVFSLKKNYTVARGIAYPFWIMMNDIGSVSDLDVELRKINAIFEEPVSDNIAEHNLVTSIGVSVFPVVAKSGKKLLAQTILATKKSQEKGGGISIYSEEDEVRAEGAESAETQG